MTTDSNVKLTVIGDRFFADTYSSCYFASRETPQVFRLAVLPNVDWQKQVTWAIHDNRVRIGFTVIGSDALLTAHLCIENMMIGWRVHLIRDNTNVYVVLHPETSRQAVLTDLTKATKSAQRIHKALLREAKLRVESGSAKKLLGRIGTALLKKLSEAGISVRVRDKRVIYSRDTLYPDGTGSDLRFITHDLLTGKPLT
jgi:hypothetical protein